MAMKHRGCPRNKHKWNYSRSWGPVSPTNGIYMRNVRLVCDNCYARETVEQYRAAGQLFPTPQDDADINVRLRTMGYSGGKHK